MPQTGTLIAAILALETTPADKRRAFGEVVRRFQDMAFGCAYSLLGEREAAEDAAQEAFCAAWQHLPQLRDPQAFPGWLRRLVLTQCRRRTRRRHPPTVPLESAAGLRAPDDPQAALLQEERRAAVRAAIGTLPEGERLAVVLFYTGDYSRAEVADFLGITELAVKKRLAAARRRLRERMLHLMEDDLRGQRPSRDPAFAGRVAAFTQGFADLIDAGTALARSLADLAARQTDADFVAAIERVNQDVQQGWMLSQSLAKHPRYFDEGYVKAVRLGEITATLELQLQRLAGGKEIFDSAGRVIVHGPEDPLIEGCLVGLLRSTLHNGGARLRLTRENGMVRMSHGAGDERQGVGGTPPELLPPLWEHLAARDGVPFSDYVGRHYQAQIELGKRGEVQEMTVTWSVPA